MILWQFLEPGTITPKVRLEPSSSGIGDISDFAAASATSRSSKSRISAIRGAAFHRARCLSSLASTRRLGIFCIERIAISGGTAMKIFGVLVGFVGLVAAAHDARAQHAAAAAEDSGQLQEIVVTAQRRSENAQSVPIAISVISATQIAEANAVDTLDLQHEVAGLMIAHVTGGGGTFLRGVGQNSGVAGQEAGVATYLDGVYLGSTVLGVFDLNNIDQVSVLKGPQGTLFGRNATGGLINITTKDPSQTTSGSIELGYGNFNTAETKFYLTGALTPTLAASLSFSGEDRMTGNVLNVYTGHRVQDEKTYTTQLKAKWVPSDDTQVTGWIGYNYGRDLDGATFAVFPGFLAVDGVSRSHDFWTVDDYVDPLDAHTNLIGSIKVTQNLGWGVLNSTSSGIYHTDESGAAQNAIPGGPNPNNALPQTVQTASHISEEQEDFNISAPSSSDWKWTAGVFFLHDVTNLRFLVDLWSLANVPTAAAGGNENLESYSYAAYGQVTKEILPATRLTAGIRYSVDKKTLSGESIAGVTPNPALPPSKQYEQPTWRVALDHNFTPNILAYISDDRGYKSGNYSLTSVTNPPFKPETVDSYEAGLKTQFLDNRIRLNTSVFYMDYKDIQIQALINGGSFIYNAAKSRMQGADADFEFVVSRNFSITGGYQYLDAKYTNFPDGIAYAVTPIGVPQIADMGCTGAASARNGGVTTLTCDLSGQTMAKAPRNSVNLGARYVYDTPVGSFTFYAADSYISAWYGLPDNLERQGSTNWLNGSITWADHDDKWNVRAWVTNALSTQLVTQISASTTPFYSPSDQRMFGIALRRSF
jgi:iron complex outermembrane receptor protein